MAYQFPDSGQQVVKQLNTLNGVNLGENDVITETTATTVKVTGINKYHNSVTVNNPKRDFNELFPQGIILRVSGLATMSGADALSLVSEKCGFTFDRSIFTDESLATTWEISWNVYTSQFALVAKEDNLDWTGTLYISLYDKLPGTLVTFGHTSTFFSPWPDSEFFAAFTHTGTGVGRVFMAKPYDNATTKKNWFLLVQLTTQNEGAQFDFDFAGYVSDAPLLLEQPTVTVGEKQYVVLYTLNGGTTWHVKQIDASLYRRDVIAVALGRYFDTFEFGLLSQRHAEFLKGNTVADDTSTAVIAKSGQLQHRRVPSDVLDGRYDVINHSTRAEAANAQLHALIVSGADTDPLKKQYDAIVRRFIGRYDISPDDEHWIQQRALSARQATIPGIGSQAADGELPTTVGHHNVAITFTNGVGQIPRDTTYYGDKLLVVNQVYTGKLARNYGSLTPYLASTDQYNPTVSGLDPRRTGQQYEIKQYGTVSGRLHDGKGNDLGPCSTDDIGKITLTDTSVNGELNVSWLSLEGEYAATANDAIIDHLLGTTIAPCFYAGSSDSVGWLAEGVGWTTYSSLGFNNALYAYNNLMRRIVKAVTQANQTPFIRTNPGTTTADGEGFIDFSSYSHNHDAFSVNRTLDGVLTVAGKCGNDAPVITVSNIPTKLSADSELVFEFGEKLDASYADYTKRFPLISLCLTDSSTGKAYRLNIEVRSKEIVEYRYRIGDILKNALGFANDSSSRVGWTTLRADDLSGHSGSMADYVFTDIPGYGPTMGVRYTTMVGTSSVSFGYRLRAKTVPRTIKCRSTMKLQVELRDVENWKWTSSVPVPDTNQWIDLPCTWVLDETQPYHQDNETRPTVPATTRKDGSTYARINLSFSNLDSSVTIESGSRIEIAWVNTPQPVTIPNTIVLDKLEIRQETNFFYGSGWSYLQRIGSVRFENPAASNLYTPGIVPYLDEAVPLCGSVNPLERLCYPGYQYPHLFLHNDYLTIDERKEIIKNVVTFWCDTQSYYASIFGVTGPVACAYVWDRWDTPTYLRRGFSMMHFGDKYIRSEHQAHSLLAAAKLKWYANDLYDTGVDKFIQPWLTYLSDYIMDHDGEIPTQFNEDGTVHSSGESCNPGIWGLWLLAMCYLLDQDQGNAAAGLIAETCYQKLRKTVINNYTVADVMNGAWSPDPDTNNNGAKGEYYGRWTAYTTVALNYYRTFLDSGRITAMLPATDTADIDQMFNGERVPVSIGDGKPSFSLLTAPMVFDSNTIAIDLIRKLGLGVIVEYGGVNDDVAKAICNAIVKYYGDGVDNDKLVSSFGRRLVTNHDLKRNQVILTLTDELPDLTFTGDIVLYLQ